MPKLRHYDNLNTVRFITIVCYRRLQGFDSDRPRKLFIRNLELARQKYNIKLFGYVIMPEHIHLVLHTLPELKLGLIIREIKSRMAREYFAQFSNIDSNEKRVFWQKRCYDHNCRTIETVREKIEYCHKNPVIRGLASEPGVWKWSSHNWYQGVRNVPIKMDKLEI